MIRFYQIIILFLLGIALMSCEDKIELELPDGETFLVVHGWITNEDGPQTVKLTYTAPYFDDGTPPVVAGAIVTLRDNEGNESTMVESSPGIYQFNEAGIIGRAYQLHINLPEGDIYESDFELLHQPVPIDSIYWGVSERTPNADFDENPDDIYEVLIDTYEPAGRGDYYQWRSFLNGVEAREPFDIFATSDQLVDGGAILEFNVTGKLYSTPDTVVIVQEKISKAAYEFLSQLQSQTAFVGSPFDTPPVPIKSNVHNLSDPNRIALGFFGAAGRYRATVIVGE